jgi:hypothetical protein
VIPQKVYDRIINSTYQNHVARLVIGNRTYSLKCGHLGVEATLFILCNLEDFPKLEAEGCETSAYRNPPLAWKPIPLSSIPQSQNEDWHFWDEY